MVSCVVACSFCRGTGQVPEASGPTIVCPECLGTGDEHRDPALGCLACRGRGRMPVAAAH
jgi:DnaJ-class molecular chaperone